MCLPSSFRLSPPLKGAVVELKRGGGLLQGTATRAEHREQETADGGAVQVEPRLTPQVDPACFQTSQLLKLKADEPVSKLCFQLFNCYLRPFMMDDAEASGLSEQGIYPKGDGGTANMAPGYRGGQGVTHLRFLRSNGALFVRRVGWSFSDKTVLVNRLRLS